METMPENLRESCRVCCCTVRYAMEAGFTVWKWDFDCVTKSDANSHPMCM